MPLIEDARIFWSHTGSLLGLQGVRKASPSHVEQVHVDERPGMQNDKVLREVLRDEGHYTPIIATGTFHERLSLFGEH